MVQRYCEHCHKNCPEETFFMENGVLMHRAPRVGSHEEGVHPVVLPGAPLPGAIRDEARDAVDQPDSGKDR